MLRFMQRPSLPPGCFKCAKLWEGIFFFLTENESKTSESAFTHWARKHWFICCFQRRPSFKVKVKSKLQSTPICMFRSHTNAAVILLVIWSVCGLYLNWTLSSKSEEASVGPSGEINVFPFWASPHWAQLNTWHPEVWVPAFLIWICALQLVPGWWFFFLPLGSFQTVSAIVFKNHKGALRRRN